MRSISIPALFLVIAATPAFGLSDQPYLRVGEPDLIHLLPPPPMLHSVAGERDINAILALQNVRTDAQAKRAEDDAEVNVFRFADVLGPNFTSAKLPTVAAFFRKVNVERARATNSVKDCWERPRPFVASTAVHPVGAMAQGVTNPPGTANTAPHDVNSPCLPVEPIPSYSYSYPSGHSTFGVLIAILLAEMVPEKRQEIYARGWEYGRNRVLGGVHYPTDVEAGRIAATLIVSKMEENSTFGADLAAATNELRSVLNFAPR